MVQVHNASRLIKESYKGNSLLWITHNVCEARNYLLESKYLPDILIVQSYNQFLENELLISIDDIPLVIHRHFWLM